MDFPTIIFTRKGIFFKITVKCTVIVGCNAALFIIIIFKIKIREKFISLVVIVIKFTENRMKLTENYGKICCKDVKNYLTYRKMIVMPFIPL